MEQYKPILTMIFKRRSIFRHRLPLLFPIATFAIVIYGLTSAHSLSAKVIAVGRGETYANLEQAATEAGPGDTILFRQGRYPGDQTLRDLKGTEKQPIHLLAETPGEVIIAGGREAWHFSHVAYLYISGFIFEGQTANGLNVDDGADTSTPSHHLTFEYCSFRNIQAKGNNDLLKLSGLDHFQIINCSFENGAAGGSGIDMVGCHNGLITRCRFQELGSNSIQVKGGSAHVRISRNYFRNGGIRTLNLGGSTGLPYFRPKDATFEASNLEVYANVIIGSGAAIAYVGALNVRVVNNTIINPKDWVIRILQETVDPKRFSPCSDNFFQNNLIYYGAVRTEVNIGSNTRPESFVLSGNFWYRSTDPNRPPELPVADPTMVFGKDPLFVDPQGDNFRLSPGSPALGIITDSTAPAEDLYGNAFPDPRAAGAVDTKKEKP